MSQQWVWMRVGWRIHRQWFLRNRRFGGNKVLKQDEVIQLLSYKFNLQYTIDQIKVLIECTERNRYSQMYQNKSWLALLDFTRLWRYLSGREDRVRRKRLAWCSRSCSCGLDVQSQMQPCDRERQALGETILLCRFTQIIGDQSIPPWFSLDHKMNLSETRLNHWPCTAQLTYR